MHIGNSIDQTIRYSLITSYIPITPSRVLEVGCGAGTLARHLASLGHHVIACDRGQVPSNTSPHNTLHFLRADGRHLPFEDSSFDIVVSCDVLEHILPDDRDTFLAQLLRVTRPGGRIILTAFFNNTWTFLLWGAFYLLSRGTLPQWYLEHITIPTPLLIQVRDRLARDGAIRKIQHYQRALGLLAFLAQELIPSYRIKRGIMRLAPVLRVLDIVGKHTSTLLVCDKHS